MDELYLNLMVGMSTWVPWLAIGVSLWSERRRP